LTVKALNALNDLKKELLSRQIEADAIPELRLPGASRL
jgi:hypothetical protein